MVSLASDIWEVYLGSAKDDAPLNEKPLTRHRFSYPFSIDSVEVTVGLYKSIMGHLPRMYDSLTTIDSDYPVVYVSWYDAVLFCNARSKKDGRDTVYQYILPEKSTSGEVIRLTGFTIDYASNGYRLPTEAEWIFAARGNSSTDYIWGDNPSASVATEYAWYAASAKSHPEKVATLQPNSIGIYDMAGNVAELVNEDLQSLPGGTVVDDVGQIKATANSKVVKGGSFYHDVRYLRLTGRTDIYHFDAASRNRYTGFRCVCGSIIKPSYRSSMGTVEKSDPVTLLPVNARALFNTNRAKLVFVNSSPGKQQVLCGVDYSKKTDQLWQTTANSPFYNPVISPDGNWIAWSSGSEGFNGSAKVYVRKWTEKEASVQILPDSSAFIPRWMVDASSGDTAIVYVTSARNNNLAAWKTTQTKMIRFENGEFESTPTAITDEGAYHGGISKDGTYLATGFPLLRMKNRATSEDRILFYAPLNGKPVPDTSQVCNVSISPATPSSDQVLFLDFGSGSKKSTLTGTNYRIHEYIFRGDFSGQVMAWYQSPQGYSSWDHTEWSTVETFAVSSAANANGDLRGIFAINLEDSSYTALCEGTELKYPYLWIDAENSSEPVQFNKDSIGQYNSPHFSNSQALLSYKMRLFWHYADSMEVVFVGSSTAADGIDPRHFSMKSLNMAVGFGDLATSMELIENYIFNHCKKVKIIGISFDMNFLFVNGAGIELYPTFIQGKGYKYDRSNDFWSSGKPPLFNEFINAVPLPDCGPPPSSIDSLGLIYCGCLGWGSEPPPVGVDTNVVFNQIYETNKNRFFGVVEECNRRGIKVLLMTFPLHPGYRKTGAYGPMGPSQSAAAQICRNTQEYVKTHPMVRFYDAGDSLLNDYNSSHFADYGHLCMDGAKRLSTRVDSILQEMLKEQEQ